MLKVPFEQFLAQLLCQHIDDNKFNETKYHYVCSDPEQATRLYKAFQAYNNGFLIHQVDGIDVNYVETPNKHKLLVMLHRNGESSRDTYNEDFIANVRDALNDIENATLFVIHNSALDTILTTCQSLSANGQVFTPGYVHAELTHLAKEHPYPILIDVISEKRVEEIKDQNLSVFGCSSLYDSIVNHSIDFVGEGLFRDERLFDIQNKREIRGDVNNNAKIYSKVTGAVADFSDNEQELVEKLEDIGFGEKFIKDNFVGKNKDNWKNQEFRAVEYELEQNKSRKLDLDYVELNGKKLTTVKRAGTKGAKYKRITLLLEAEVGNLDLKFRMHKGDPLLKTEQLSLKGDYQKHQMPLKTSNHENQSVISTTFNYDGGVKFFSIKLNRPSSSENYQFDCLMIKSQTFELGRIFEKLTVEFKRNNGTLLLENVTESLVIKPEQNKEYLVENTNAEIDLEEVGVINFSEILKKEVSTEVLFKYQAMTLPAYVAGKVTLDPIKLPSILDTQRARDIDLLDGNARYNADTQQVIVSGKEKGLSVGAKTLCRIEYKFVEQSFLYIDEISRETLTIDQVGEEFVRIANAYREMFNWLQVNETVISLTSWPKEFKQLVENVLKAVNTELALIPNDSLGEQHRKLLKIGVYHGLLTKDDTTTEWFTPYHPLILAYAYQLADKLEETGGTIEDIPDTTLDKLSPAGLLPIVFDPNSDYAFTVANNNNKLWLQVVPQKQNNHDFVIRLVDEKVNDFISCFEMLFIDNETAPLIINSIHNQSNKFIFKGLAKYFKKHKNKAKKIHVNLYDDRLYKNYFDIFAESKDIEDQRALVRSSEKEKAVIADELLAIMRDKLSYSKITNSTEYGYAHIAFYKNNEKVEVKDKQVNNAKSGLACQGLISGEASYLENQNYYTGFGLKGIEEQNHTVALAEKYNALLKPFKDPSASYIAGVVPILVVKDTFKTQLNASYDSSIWTCIIDPKVTLKFFDDKDTILVHYSDQYTNSIAYDAITVSSRVALYKGLLKEEADELLNSFNAVSGQWLLDIIKSTGKPQTTNNEKQLKEKQGIIAAYKFLAGFLLDSDITWVPLSIAELIRVTGNVGLKIKDSDFSVRLQNKNKGAMSDDMLFVGFKDGAMYLLPLEVKTREKGNDFTKAIEQAYELACHMYNLLAPSNLKGQLYRSLFIQHVMSQIERFELYKVFPEGYFDNLRDQREVYQQGNYQLLAIDNFVTGVAVALNNNKESSRLTVNKDAETNILTVELSFGLMKTLQCKSLRTLADKLTTSKSYPELVPYILGTTTSTNIENNVKSYSELTTHSTSNDENNNEIDLGHSLTSTDEPIALFDYPPEYKNLVEAMLKVFQRDLTKEDIIALTENDLRELFGGDDSVVLNFFRLKEALAYEAQSEKPEVKVDQTQGSGLQLIDLHITQEYQALCNFVLRAFGENITVDAVIALTVPDLLDQPGFGKRKLTKFEDFRNLLKQNKFSISVSNEQPHLIENYDIGLDDLENELIASLDKYLETGKVREKNVFVRRFGLGCESMTLEEVGKGYGVTREAIRQTEKRAKQNLLSHLTVAQNVVKVVTQANLSELREPLFKRLRARFDNDKQFYAFIELCCGLEENEIRSITSPNISRDYFNEFWVTNKSPAPLEELTWYLHETLNVEIAVAENQVLCWKHEGYLELNNELVKPLKLPKVEALTNTLLELPSGAPWLMIQTKIIDKEITFADITTDRVDPSLMTACDREYIYQCDRGTYRHLAYLGISQQEREYVLNVVKAKVQEHSYAGRDSVNLAVDIYDQHKFTLDYFTVRHIVRTYGETNGVFFNGKSGSDTVSLNREFDLASQKTVLVDLFKTSLKPLDKNTVASKIRSKSIGHAAFYLDKLLTEGTVVRVDETHFAHVDNAFKDIDIAKVMEKAIAFIENEPRIIEGESLQTSINRQLSLKLNKYYYLSLLKVNAAAYGLDLHFVQNLISKQVFSQTGLADFCRAALENTTSNSEALAQVKLQVCAHDHVIKRCLNQVGTKNTAETDKSTYAEEKEIPSVESCRVLIGQALDTAENVFWEYGNKSLANRHLIVFGRSGQGKTYCIQSLLMELAKSSFNSMVVDYTNGFLPEQLEPEFNQAVKPQTDLIAHKPLNLNPFKKQKSVVAGIELQDKPHDIATRVAAVFNSVFSSIGEQQLPTLIRVIEEGIELYGSDYNFNKMLDDLEAQDQTGVKLANKLMPIVKANIFSCSANDSGWENIYSSKDSICRLIQMAKLSRDVWRSATEFILWDLYSYACLFGNKTKPLPVVLDEVQNLDHRLDSPLAKMLTEGRKYGLSLILATQTLSNLKKEEQDRLFQAAHKLFFAPAETEMDSYAKLLEQAVPGTNKKVWRDELAKLKKGECISVGLHMNTNGVIEQGAKVVKVTSLGDR